MEEPRAGDDAITGVALEPRTPPESSDATRTAILVTGMHRSGTSALTRVLSLLGATLPDDPIPGRVGDNESGFWESRRVVDVNQEILSENGSWWCGWQQIELEPDRLAEAVRQAQDVIREEFGAPDLLVLKDPRVSRLLPVWKTALHDLGYRCVYVLALRDPAEVAGSLGERNGLSPQAAGLAWLAHTLDAERASRDEPRVVIDYADLLTDWRTQADRVSARLGIDWPRTFDEVSAEVGTFLDPALRTAPRLDLGVVGPVFAALRRLSRDESRKDDARLLDDWHARLQPIREHVSAVSRFPATRRQVVQAVGAGTQEGSQREDDQSWLRTVHDAYAAEAAMAWAWLEEEWRLVRRLRKQRRTTADLRRKLEARPANAKPVIVLKTRRAAGRVLRKLGLRRTPVQAPDQRSGVVRQNRGAPAPSVAGPPGPADAPVTAPADLQPSSNEQAHPPTNVGPLFDSGVVRASQRQMPPGVDPDYDLVRENFDLAGYLLQAPGLLNDATADPVARFLKRGTDAPLTPDVNFSMTSYLRLNPHRRSAKENPYLAWLKRGRSAGEIADPAPGVERVGPLLGMETPELVQTLAGLRDDLQERLRFGELGQMVREAAEIEPLVSGMWKESARPKFAPVVSDTVVGQMISLHQCQQDADFRPARLVLMVNRPRWGGGRRAEGHLTHALSRHVDPTDMVVIYTDDGGETPASRYPDGVREVHLAAATQGLGPRASQRVLIELLRSLRSDAIVNINSALFYGALVPYGKALAQTERIFHMLFCNDQTPLGYWSGYPLRQFYRCFDTATGFLTDSEHLANWLRTRHKLPEGASAKIHSLPTPVDASIEACDLARVAESRSQRLRPRVYWAGRWDRQKRLDIVMEIAARMPDVDFHLWGEAVVDSSLFEHVPPNVIFEGRYRHIGEIDLTSADAWLYTSGWDGVPNQLLEVVMTGTPVVASVVGGTGEVLTDTGSWPIRAWEDPSAYEKALREILTEPEAARIRALELREHVVAERTEAAYSEVARTLLLPECSAAKEVEGSD